ncbi:T9SS type B sorting domain-containing protein [Cryomorpha ignava]|uniref:T9SS type B sorting domain-containing protein n=1 Tax=Cryomorpha ignava TaxID=101383 RepID=A0A7K3WNX2_9FLAO|nr:gliding motility-associated C-terminal domain-containing protein [Cryomorpha ignava]NEN22721.1 T9SS type B sorting domain-containing protein [Cryomorpha ignava]
MYAQLTNGLLLDYQLNGNFLDSSPNGYNGTGFNGTFANDNMGNPQGALAANGNNTYVEFPNVPELKPDFPITMAVRVSFDYLDGTQIIAATDFGVNTHSGAWLQVSSQDKITASYGNAGGGFNGSSRHGKQANFNLQSYTWYSIVAIFRGYQDIDIYIDCELQEGFYTGNAQTIGYTDAAGSLCRKRGSPESTTPPYYLSGDIDYFMYWDRELTPEEIVPLCEDCPGELVVLDNQRCVGQVVGYTFGLNAPASDINEALWTFADGSVSYNWLSYKTYDSVGSYPFTLQVTTENGCVFETSGITLIIEIPDNPVLPDSISICQGDSYFLDLSDFSDWDQILDSNGNPVTSYSFDEPGIFNFEFIHACGPVEVSVEVFQTNITGYLTYVGENPICENSVVAFEINEWEDIQDSVTFFLNFGNGNGEIVSNASMSNLYSNAGTYLIELSGTISNCEVDESLTLNVEAPLDFELDSLYDICQGAVVSINFDDYNFPVFDSNGSEIEIFNSDSSGTYVFSAQNACGLVSEQIEIEVTPFQPNPFAQEILICPVTDTLIIGFGSNSYMYSWNTGQNTPIITVNSGGNYSVTVIDSSGFCSNNYIFNVAETPLILDSIFNVPEIEFCMEGNTVLTPNNLGFPYTFPDGSIDTSYDVKVPGTITVNYSDGCYEYQESIEIAIENCLCPLIVPNIFTPNGDGKNEVFKTSYNCETPIFYMSVFNRWGQLIFESSDIDIGWNGQIIDNQNESSEGVYFYLIEYAQYVDDLPHYKTLKGNVTLLR